MSCSRAFACRRSVCSFGIGTASFSQQFVDGRKHRRGVRELGKHDQTHRQKRRAAGDRGIDHREHAIGVRAHVRSFERIGQSRSGRRRRNSGWESYCVGFYCSRPQLLALRSLAICAPQAPFPSNLNFDQFSRIPDRGPRTANSRISRDSSRAAIPPTSLLTTRVLYRSR